MAEEDTTCVGEKAKENTEACDTEHSVMQQETDEDSQKQLSADTYYKYEDVYSRPSITPDSEIPENLLHLSHSFGYDSGRRANLQVLDDRTLIFIAGNLLVLLDISTKEQRYLRSCSGGGIGSIAVHPSKDYFVSAEKGNQPNVIIYEYPSLRPYRILRGGTEKAYSFVDFNRDGSLLASVGCEPDYMLTLWNWRQEEVMLSCKAVSQEVYRVSFSPYNPGLLTSSGSGHIKFWKMASTFTGLKLQGLIGNFGKTAATDIEGYVELPDGKVVSGTDWGNLLLWDGNAIKVEICRKEGRTCHAGMVQPFALEDGQLMTIGSDGVVQGWDFESIDSADSSSDCNRFEIEPMNEMVVGHNVCLSSVVKSSLPDSFLWFAQDSSGAIWKLDLSFTYTTPDPECLFSFHAGAIQGLDVSKKSHLMATTALDRSVRVFDFLAKTELTTSRFNQGGTALSWAPPMVNQGGGLLVTGFEDGVVRLLELYNPQRLHVVTGRSPKGDAKLRLKQAFKPHNAPVTAVAYERNGDILATGSSDCTVFFFIVGEKYNPIGFVHVPGPVQGLEWSPHSHSENRLLILCQSGHVTEVQCPDPEAQKPTKTFQLPELSSRSFRFSSIKSRIKREEEIARRQAVKEKKRKEREKRLKESKHPEAEQEEEEEEKEEELPPIYIPDPPSPLYCGFYSQPGQFWLSMGGFDSGFLYHCKFSEKQDEDPDQRQDEPFGFLPVDNTDNDPVRSINFSSNRQLMLCGMHSGSIRVYLLQPGDHSLTSMQAYWALSVHDNQYGQLRHIRCSHDEHFVLTAGDDGNIFSFSLLPPEELQKGIQRKRAKVPSPRVGLENEALAQDIEDPAAYSIETAKQKLEKDRLQREAELKITEKRKKMAQLQKKFKEVLDINQSLPEHVRLKPEELQLDRRFSEEAERVKSQQVMEVRKQLAWEEERAHIALSKLQEWFKDSLEDKVVTVVAICTDHRVSTYRLPTLTKPSTQLRHQSKHSQLDRDTAPERRKSRAEPAKDSGNIEEEEVVRPKVARPAGIKLGDRQVERLRKAAEKAEQARAKIEKRKQEWDQLYAEKPDDNCEDPLDVQAICKARENIGDLKLKSAKDFTVPKHLRMNTESKRAQLIGLEENIREKQTEMNGRIVALRDSKVCLVSQLRTQAQKLQKVQQRLAAHLHRPPPALPTMLPEETPEKRLQYSRATLERYRVLREQRFKTMQQEEQGGTTDLLEQLEKEMKGEMEKEGDDQERGEEGTSSTQRRTREEEDTSEEEGMELSELEEKLHREKEIRLLFEQDSLLEQMESSVCHFDAKLMLLRHQKLRLDWQLKMADLRQLTLYQELLLLKEFDRREDSLHEKLNARVKEENNIVSELEECKEQLELKQRDIVKLQEREKALTTTFQASLGEDNKFEEFLTRVFKKKIKRVKKKEQTGSEEEEDSDEDSDEDDDWDDDDDDFDSGTEDGVAALDDSVCPPGCEPELFENTLQLRERRLDLEELLVEEKKSAEVLKKECDTLTKKEKAVKSGRKAVEDDLELVNREKQKKMNELDVVVPLRLHQIEFVFNGSVPSDLSSALVVDRTELSRLQERIKQLQVEKSQQRDLYTQARQQHVRLIHDRRDMDAKIQVLEKQCDELMMMKYGRLLDLEALQTLSGNRVLEELKQEKLIKEAAYAKEIKQWDAKVEEARQNLMEATKTNTERLLSMSNLLDHKRDLERKLNARQKKVGRPFQDYRRHVDQEEIHKLKILVKTQSQQAEVLRREIDLLSRKGGHVLPPGQAPLPPLPPLPTSTARTKIGKQGSGRPSHLLTRVQNSQNRQGAI
ncbi:cilia- and flagella-associated protein 44 [Seriola aureovittata]|uniref:cilia- and flagella-associated protein 44 n=1 Tax=Seriola aureovittata TaxID=2871759 RepID=UPI0024BEBFF6|nr:cilia- and flagella-associated protein 44 [Seriola aureovittata]XP_056259642.1 cilia- and flagella-associated protein 44 [Seriola aureovittata]